jgi:succinate dehydrogenase / fumarate reductase membrane anchor subunit
MPGFEHADAIAFIASPWNAVGLLMLCVSLAYHSYLGVQVVIEDYVHAPGIHVASLIASRIAHAVFAIIAVVSILKIGFGA